MLGELLTDISERIFVAGTHFDGAPQTLTTGTNHGSTQLVQQRPRRLIASDSKFPLQPQSADPILLACEMPHCSEPECQREVAVLKNSARKDINLPPTRDVHIRRLRLPFQTPCLRRPNT